MNLLNTFLKRNGFLLFLFLLTNPVFSQNRNIILYKLDSLKKGVYKNFEEFKFNNPSQQIPLEVKPKTKKIVSGVFQIESLTSYWVYYNKNSFKLDSGEFWGFCDGKNLYINSRPERRPKGKVLCEKIFHVDRFCSYQKMTYTNGGIRGGGGSYIEDMVLSLKTGEILSLDKGMLMKLFELKDPELYESYKAEDHKKDKVQMYLQKYCDRHKNEL